MDKKIHARGFWQSPKIDHYYDPIFSKKLNLVVSNYSSVVDFGCGNAKYAKYIKEQSKIDVDAFDGNPHVSDITEGFASLLDLSKDFDLSKKYDVVISLEVAEHIPKQYEETYVNNLVNHCEKMIIISWAKIGQGGKGHVNEQNSEYVVDLFGDMGFYLDEDLTKLLRESSTVCRWFKDTVHVFKRKSLL
jgi:cyclopropane fatty-acyl-phospholipid synthase-like methyltransferase